MMNNTSDSKCMNPVKKLIIKALYHLGYEIKGLSRDEAPRVEPIAPIDVLDLVIERERTYAKNWYFIQIGAHDGVSVDPIRRYITKYGWPGILVEPQPKLFSRLREAYKDQPNVILENAAIGREDGFASLYTFKESPHLPYHATMLASFYRKALEHNGHGYKGEIEELTVPTISVRTLLAKHSVSQVNLLQIDTEGFDREIVRMFIESDCLPPIVHFEDAVGLSPENQILRELNRLGYGISYFYPDSLAYRERNNAEFRRRTLATQEDLEALKPPVLTT